MTLYNEDKSINGLNAEITGEKVFWDNSEGKNGVEVADGAFAVYVTPTTALGADIDESKLSVYAGLYSADKRLLKVDKFDYISGATTSDEIMHDILISELDEEIEYVKVFVWNDKLSPMCELNEFKISDYLTAE